MRRVSVLVLTLLCAMQVPASAAPSLTALTLSSDAVGPGIPLTVSGQFSQPTQWRVDVVAACGGATKRTLTGFSNGGAWQAQWDGLDAANLPLSPGSYRMRVAPTDAVGNATATPSEKGFEVTGTSSGVCDNVLRFAELDVYEQGIADVKESSASSVIITTATDLGYAAIASSYAHRMGAPLILLPAKQPANALVSLLAKRKLKAVIVGPSSAVPTTLDTALKLKKVVVVRLAGTDRAGTAAAVAVRLKPAPNSTAVYAPLGGDGTTVAIAVAYANALGVPMLAAGTTLPGSTKNAIATLRLQGGVAIGDSAPLPDVVLKQLPNVSRIIGKDLASTSFALARSIPAGQPTLVVDSAAQPDPLQLVLRARLGEPQLLLGEVSTAMKAWLSARADLTQAVVTARVGRGVSTTIGRLMADRGAVGALPLVQAKPFAPVTVPQSFTFSGSGFGHGVGLSQWGAYGQAKEGRTASEILQYYFTGSVVAPIDDTADITVSLDSRVASGTFRLEKLSDANAKLELTDGDGNVRLAAVGDVVSTKYNSGKIDVAITGSLQTSFSTSSLTLRWSGNREPSSTNAGASVLRYAGPGVSIEKGSRYRYGYVVITPAKVSGGLSLGLQINNLIRLHDEYLYGVAEVSSSWPSAAIQSQIIAARSYAYKKLKAGIRSACACHIYDDPRDQNFTGYAKLAEKSGSTNYGALWKAAVDATAVSPTQGLVLTVGGQVVSAFYSAATGGRTQNNEDVWGGSALSYTRSVDDPWSLTAASASVSRWVPRSFTQAEIAAAFGAPDVVSIDFSDRYASGAVNNATAVSSSGLRFTVGAETLKSRLNKARQDAEVMARGIPSVWIWRVDEDVDAGSAAAATLDLATSSAIRGLALPQATSTTVVLVQSDATNATLALAASYAGQKRFGLLTNAGPDLDAATKTELLRRKAAKVVFVGPTTAQSAVTALKIPTVSIMAPTAAALSALLALDLGVPSGTPAVFIASIDDGGLPLAVNLSVRTRSPLLYIDNGSISGEVSAVVTQQQPASSVVIGAADRVPDAAVAGIGTVERLTTGDPKLASILAFTQRVDSSTSGVALVNPLAPTAIAIVSAGLGLPLLYMDDAIPSEAFELERRTSAMTLVVRVGITPDVVTALRRA